MARKRAVILETDGHVARVLASGGEFRTIKAPKGLDVGDELFVDAVMPAYNWRPQLALVATLVIMLVFSSAGLSNLATSFNQVAAYVTVDINPSVELAVNRWGWVISARGLNTDGIQLLAGTEYRSFKLADIVPQLAMIASDRGYIAEGKPNTVIVAAAPADRGTVAETVQHEMQLAKKQTATAVSAKQGPPVTVSTIVAPDANLRGDAEAMNTSLGKLAVVLEARQSGVPVRLSDVERDGLAKAIEAAGGKYHDIVIKAQEADYHTLAQQYSEQLKREKDDDKGKDKDKGHGNGKSGKDGGTQGSTGSGQPGQSPAPGDNATGNGGTPTGNTGTEPTPGTSQSGSQNNGQPGPGNSGGGNGQTDSGKDNDKGNGNDKDKGNGKDKDKGNDKGDVDKFADRMRDGFRELGERIKHGIGKGK